MQRKTQQLVGGLLGFATIMGLLRRMGTEGYIVALVVLGLGVLYEVPRIVSTEPTRASVQRWHGGQLILFCVAVTLAGWVCVKILDGIQGGSLVGGLLMGALLAVPVAIFATAWVWFAGRGTNLR